MKFKVEAPAVAKLFKDIIKIDKYLEEHTDSGRTHNRLKAACKKELQLKGEIRCPVCGCKAVHLRVLGNAKVCGHAQVKGDSHVLGDKIKSPSDCKNILNEEYHITILPESLKIGCEYHTKEEWWNFTDKEILAMDGRAGLRWWRKWKPLLMAICEAERKAEEK